MRKPEVLFTILSILVLSILINLGFCIRCLLFRSYIGKPLNRIVDFYIYYVNLYFHS
ncbi:hypothetical protein Smp_159390 [Schistosoma mansoni]|uniref:hypothetical protein n=1 Tax=Schistosoma mansoni TaxID=6183 RepID=UPI00022C83FE|nr:hypothetical protein Smp_159390 [Schistosoma mansoni]|eukprot:XP_018645711.1 hypothetical protein Smp_159390 [Schistosoma mansoni]